MGPSVLLPLLFQVVVESWQGLGFLVESLLGLLGVCMLSDSDPCVASCAGTATEFWRRKAAVLTLDILRELLRRLESSDISCKGLSSLAC